MTADTLLTTMHYSSSVILVFVASSVALPALLEPRQPNETSNIDQNSHDDASAWDAGATRDFRIHQSCNATEMTQLRKGLADAMTLATHAKQYILRFSNSSDFYQKYFGDAPTGEAIGYFEKLINGDRGNALFRCDNPDGNCKNKGTCIQRPFLFVVLRLQQDGAGTGAARMPPARLSSVPSPTKPAGHWNNCARSATQLPGVRPTPTSALILSIGSSTCLPLVTTMSNILQKTMQGR